jgi:hypothetical protein
MRDVPGEPVLIYADSIGMLQPDDVACPRIRGRCSHADLVEKIQPDNAGVVLADASIVHDHRTHRPPGRIEGVVAAAI